MPGMIQYREAQVAREAKVARCVERHYSASATAAAIGMSVDQLERWLISRGRKGLWDALLASEAEVVPERPVPRDLTEHTADAIMRVLAAAERAS